MKEPPDVIVFEIPPKENPLIKWIILSNWAIDNNDGYLQQRAHEMVVKLLGR